MTILEAVNQCLEDGAGMPAVNSVEGDEALRAKRKLDRVRLDVLVKGYPFNIDTRDLMRRSDGTIVIPETFLAVMLPEPYKIRNRKVFDPENITFDIGKDFTDTEVAMDVPFDQLPHVVASYIAAEATMKFCASVRTAASPQYAYTVHERNRASVSMNAEYPVPVDSQYNTSNARLSGFRSNRSRYVGCSSQCRWCSCV